MTIFSPIEMLPVLDVKDPTYDLVLVVTDKLEKLTGNLSCLKAPLDNYAKVCYHSAVKISPQPHKSDGMLRLE